MSKWRVKIYSKNGETRWYELDHEYGTEWEAMREAVRLADNVFIENDRDWTLEEVADEIAGKLCGNTYYS
jgi:hypothetical protein